MRRSISLLLLAVVATTFATHAAAQQTIELEWHHRGDGWALVSRSRLQVEDGRIVVLLPSDDDSPTPSSPCVAVTRFEQVGRVVTVEFELAERAAYLGECPFVIDFGPPFDPRSRFAESPVLVEAFFNDSTLVGVVTEPVFGLAEAAPSPFNPATTISYSIPAAGHVSITVYNALGQHVRTLIEGDLRFEGHHSVVWDGQDDHGRNATSGLYLFRIQWRSNSSSARWTTAVRVLRVQ